MIQRTTQPNNPAYSNYGKRGIVVCERWRTFAHFLADMGERPAGMTLERNDNDREYSPENCKWASRKEQMRNTRVNRLLTINGKTQCVSAWAEGAGIKHHTLRARLRLGWPIEKALSQPINERIWNGRRNSQ